MMMTNSRLDQDEYDDNRRVPNNMMRPSGANIRRSGVCQIGNNAVRIVDREDDYDADMEESF